MTENIVMHNYCYLMNSNYERINLGKCFDVNFKTYEKNFVEKMISYFEEKEEYEKCKVLLDFSKERFDHEKNYALA